MKVSIVVPTYNRKESLVNTIKSLKSIDYPKNDYEIIIIDSSTDGTRDLIKNIKGIRYFFQKKKSAATARNAGIKKARAEYIFFTDDDCIVPKEWIKTFLKEYKNDNIAGVGGPMIIYPDLKNNYYSSFLELNNNFPKKIIEDKMENYYVGATCNMSYKKEIIKNVKGFDESFPTGEDAELKKKITDLGYNTIFVPLPVKHHHRNSLKSIIKLSIDRGIGHYFFCKKFNENVRKLFYLHILSIIPFILPISIIVTLILSLKELNFNLKYVPLDLLSKYLFSYGILKGYFIYRGLLS